MDKNKSYFFKDDKDVFDALIQRSPSKKATLQHLKMKGIFVSSEDTSEQIAEYASPLFVNYIDQKFISDASAKPSSKPRYMSTEILVDYDVESLQSICEDLGLEVSDTIDVSLNNGNIHLSAPYIETDLSKNVLSQNVPKVTHLEIKKTDDNKILVRAENNKHAQKIQTKILNKIEDENPENYEEISISLVSITDAKDRTDFFLELITNIDGYNITDVKSVSVSKGNNSINSDEDDNDENLSFIKKVVLNGGSVHNTPEFNNLLKSDFYITKIEWTVESSLTTGEKIDIYAEFKDTERCSDFSYAIHKIYKRKDGSTEFVVNGKSPSAIENATLLPKIEKSSKLALETINNRYEDIVNQMSPNENLDEDN